MTMGSDRRGVSSLPAGGQHAVCRPWAPMVLGGPGGSVWGGPAAQAMRCPRAGQHRMIHPAPPAPHRAVLTQHREYEMIIPNDQILIMQHRG